MIQNADIPSNQFGTNFQWKWPKSDDERDILMESMNGSIRRFYSLFFIIIVQNDSFYDGNDEINDQCNGSHLKSIWACGLPITVCNNIYTWFHSLIRFSFLVKRNLNKRLNVLGNNKWRSISVKQLHEWEMKSSCMDPMICYPAVQ